MVSHNESHILKTQFTGMKSQHILSLTAVPSEQTVASEEGAPCTTDRVRRTKGRILERAIEV